MNYYQIIKTIKERIDALEELNDIAEVQLMNGYDRHWKSQYLISKLLLKELKPLMQGVYPFELAMVSPQHYAATNNRICIFKSVREKKLVYAMYSEQAAVNYKDLNDHHALGQICEGQLASNDWLSTDRWCGFYTVLYGNYNDGVTMVLYGQSTYYGYTMEKDSTLLQDFLREINKDADNFHKIDRLLVQDPDDKNIFYTVIYEES